jgi:folate-binding protein YgfZ
VPKGWFVDPRLATLGARAILKKGTRPENIRATSFDDYDRHRIARNIPDGSRDMIVGQSTLLECNIDKLNGISWTKGCYMGQELTARMHHRGLAKKRLFPVKISGATPKFGAIVRDGETDIGDMRSSCGNIGLALLDVGKAEAALKSGGPFACGGIQLLVLNSFQKE